MNILIIITAVILVIGGYIYYSYKKLKNIPAVEKSQKIKDLTDKNFNNQIMKSISLVDFWAPWCMPCKMMAPVLNEIAEEADGKVQVCKVNVDQFQSLASKYGIRGIPTTVMFRNGKEIKRFTGVKSKNFLLDQINSVK
ncbi:MAG: thioredoxin [Bacteroidales bacterium]